MKFLVYGCQGWIGSKVYNHLKENNYEVVEGNSRVNNVKHLEAEIQEVQPTHVLSLIGRTHGTYEGQYIGTIDYLEKPGKLVENVRDNLFGPMVLGFLSKKSSIEKGFLTTSSSSFTSSSTTWLEMLGVKRSSIVISFSSSI